MGSKTKIYKVSVFADYKSKKKTHKIYSIQQIDFEDAKLYTDTFKYRDDTYPLEHYHYYLTVFETAFYFDQHVVSAEMTPEYGNSGLKDYNFPFMVDIVLTAYSEENANKLAEMFINDWFFDSGKENK